MEGKKKIYVRKKSDGQKEKLNECYDNAMDAAMALNQILSRFMQDFDQKMKGYLKTYYDISRAHVEELRRIMNPSVNDAGANNNVKQ
jgi:hypothetical protein